MMAASSPPTFESQIYQANERYQDEAGSASVSQLAFNTQLPYNNSLQPDQDLSPNVEDPHESVSEQPRRVIAGEALPKAPTQEPVDTSILQANQPQEQRRSPSTLLKKPRLVDRGENVGNNNLTSSNESIECQPYIAPAQDSSPINGGLLSQPDRDGTEDAQPFPLVEWIKEIRKDTFKQRPMLPMRWARSISKKQQAILASDDTWLPPLAGKPTRPGSVPLDLLQRLTSRADTRASLRARTEEDIERKEHDKEATPVNLPQPGPSYDGPASQHSSLHEADDADDDEETIPASQWSSSPPRPRVPPDSDPVTEFYKTKIQENPEASHAQPEPVAEVDGPSQVGQPEEGPEGVPERVLEEVPEEQPEEQPTVARNDLHQLGGPEVVPVLAVEHAHSPVAQTTAAKDAPTDLTTQSQPEPQTVRSKFVAKVQVKDTTYPPKEFDKPPQSSILPSEAPQSSLVGATHPEIPYARPRKVFFGNELGGDKTVVSVQGIDARHSPFSPRVLKRPLDCHNGGNEDLTDGRVPLGNQGATDAMNTMNATVTRKPAVRTPTSDHMTAPPHKRQKLGQSTTANLLLNKIPPDYQQHDNQRMLERRGFLRSISTGWTNAGPEDPEAFLQHNNRAQTKTSSRASSPPASARHSNLAGSEAMGTSATNLSVHESHMARTPARRLVSRRSSIYDSVEDDHLASTFSRFKHAYPNYRGNQKSFRSALQLLLRLQSQPREPHPSMWDDFIFRMAHDYKQYLVECIDDDQSAVEYQDYYYTRVRRSERSHEVITEDVLQNLVGHARSDQADVPYNRLRQSRSVSSFRVARDIAMKDAPLPPTRIRHEEQGASEQPKRKTDDQTTAPIGMDEKGQEVDEHEIPETQAMTVPPTSRSRQSLPSQATRSQPEETITKSAAKKRQSLPWDTTRSNADKKSARTPLQKITNSSSAPSATSSKVEKWLLSSRAAGVESPELEAIELPTPGHTSAKLASPVHNPMPALRLPMSAVTAAEHVTQSVESPAATSTTMPKPVRQAETKYRRFADNYAKLQPEKAFRALPIEKKRVPINIYEW
ncbi:hypothetical protein PMZ80_004169 [Knufia obscura]|nr:hypothetical protein PMZ80_004169 [Knufia obscura]